MTSTLSPTQSRFADAPSVGAMVQPTDLDGILKRPSFGKRASRGLTRFLIVFCIGVAATLAWQSYGNAAREMIANSYPQFGWLAPQAAAPEQTAPYSNVHQLATALLDLTTVRQSLDQIATRQQQAADGIGRLQDQLATRQQVTDAIDKLHDQLATREQQVADAINKLQATERDILNKVSAPSQQPSTTPARKPVPGMSSSLAPRIR